jgi:hypothetical protein
MYRTQSERAGDDPPPGGDEFLERRRKKRGLQLSSLGEFVLERIALGPHDLRSASSTSIYPSSEPIGVTVQSEFLVCAGGVCVPTDGPLRRERHLGVDYIVGRSTWERCESASHAERRLAGRIDELDPHELASEAVALADPGFD